MLSFGPVSGRIWNYIYLHWRDYVNINNIKIGVDKRTFIANTANQHKSLVFGGVSMAGNEKSGNVIAFRMSENELKKAIDSFRDQFADGSRGMVTWPRFCAFLGYSVEEVRECYLRGKEGKNAYNGRADLLGKFQTECHALTSETCDKKQQLARDEIKMDYLALPGQENAPPEVRIVFGAGDDRWIEAMK